MQVFVTSSDPKESADRLWRDPVRARKMIVEYQQLLACAQKEFGILDERKRIRKTDGGMYKTPSHIRNHPAGKWTCAKIEHAQWLTMCLKQLHSGYQGDGFKVVPRNIARLEQDFPPIDFDVWLHMEFNNNAKKGAADPDLDFTWMGSVFAAYDAYLQAQGA